MVSFQVDSGSEDDIETPSKESPKKSPKKDTKSPAKDEENDDEEEEDSDEDDDEEELPRMFPIINISILSRSVFFVV